MPAICKPFEADEMRRERRRDIRLALNRVYRVILAAEHEGRTLDAAQVRQHVERVALAARCWNSCGTRSFAVLHDHLQARSVSQRWAIKN